MKRPSGSPPWTPVRSTPIVRRLTTTIVLPILIGATAAAAADHDTSKEPVVYRAYYPLDDSKPDPPLHIDAMGKPTAESRLRSFLAAHTGMDYTESRREAIELIRLAPDRYEGYYNLACSLARLRRNDESLDALERAVERGWRDHVHTALDPDLHPLRAHERFGQIIDDMRHRRKNERISCRDLRSDSIPTIAAELEEAVPDLLNRYHVPGVSIALVRDGEVAWTGAFGTRSRTTNEPITANDRCRLSAVHDMLIMLTALDLHRDGELNIQSLLAEADVRGWRGGDTPLRTRSIDDEARRHRTVRTGAEHWPRSQIIPGTAEVLATAIEAIGDDDADALCAQSCIAPLSLRDTSIVRARPLGVAQVAADDDESSTDLDPRPVGIDVLDKSPLGIVIHGHSSLGTPLQAREPGPLHQGPLVETNAADLARLLAHAGKPAEDPDPRARDLFALDDDLRARGRKLGVDLQLHRTIDGPRLQLAEMSQGVGCLARLYPETGDGVVILFNSANGRDVALRIAQLAIGGH